MTRHGPHEGDQKSSYTGRSRDGKTTSASTLSAETSRIQGEEGDVMTDQLQKRKLVGWVGTDDGHRPILRVPSKRASM